MRGPAHREAILVPELSIRHELLDRGTAKTPIPAASEVERAGIEPATSGLQSSTRRSLLSLGGWGLPVRAGTSRVALRGSPGAAVAFRRPRAGCMRDELVVSAVNTSIKAAGLTCGNALDG